MSNSKQTSNGGGFAIPNAAGNLASNSVDRANDKLDLLVGVGDTTLGRFLQGPKPGKFFSLFLLIPALIALGISSYLAYVAITASEVAGCGAGDLIDCGHVLHSKYAKWFGLPVSILAAINYLFMVTALIAICCSARTTLTSKISWATVAFAGISAGMAAIWFVGLQIFVIGKYCPWCLGAHTCGLVIAISLLVNRPFGAKIMMAGSAFAAAGIAALVLGQVTAEEPPTFKIIEHTVVPQDIRTSTPGESEDTNDGLFEAPKEEDGSIFQAPSDASVTPRKIRSFSIAAQLLAVCSPAAMVTTTGVLQEEATKGKQEESKTDKPKSEPASEPKSDQETEEDGRRFITIQGNVKLDTKQWPMLGSPDAKYIFAEMFDYSCPHCRETHKAIKGAFDIMGDELAVMVLPVPLNSSCNTHVTATGANFVESCELSKLAVACWRLDAEKFHEFHHWMFEGSTAPTYATAKAKADELVGREDLDAELRKEAPGKYITKHVQLYQIAGRGVVPKLLFPTTTVEGAYTSPNSLVELIRERAK